MHKVQRQTIGIRMQCPYLLTFLIRGAVARRSFKRNATPFHRWASIEMNHFHASNVTKSKFFPNRSHLKRVFSSTLIEKLPLTSKKVQKKSRQHFINDQREKKCEINFKKNFVISVTLRMWSPNKKPLI